MWTSEPGPAPGARGGQSAPEERAGMNGQRERNGASFSAMEQTQPRLATPPPHRTASQLDASAANASGVRDTSKRKRITDSAWMPALRLNRRERAPRVE